MTRPHKLTLDQRATLAAMWADPRTNQREIARAVGLHHSNLWRYADLLKLPRRKWPRTAHQRTTLRQASVRVIAMHEQAARAQVARCEAYLAAEREREQQRLPHRCLTCNGRERPDHPHRHAA